MILATSTSGERKILFLGLTNENITLLKNDFPIYKNLQKEGLLGLEEWDLYILGPEDTTRFIANVRPEEDAGRIIQYVNHEEKDGP